MLLKPALKKNEHFYIKTLYKTKYWNGKNMEVKVLINSPQKDSDIIYATGYSCLDPIAVIDVDNEVYGFFPSTEIGRAVKSSYCKECLNLNQAGVKTSHPEGAAVLNWLKQHDINKISVPYTFPVAEADFLRNNNIEVNPVRCLYPNRNIKREDEIEKIREVSKKNIEVMDCVKTLLAECSVNADGELVNRGAVLTSEDLQNFIFEAFLHRGLQADSVIAASGVQACDPHEAGHGAIHEKEAIIVDIFPSDRANHYYSDMTRTFCKHKAPQALQEIYDAVKEIQIQTLSKVKNGADGKIIHKEVQAFFVNKGFQTCREGSELYGFFHGTGHGVGLDCHEEPRISSGGSILHTGELVTVEPGLYYPERGAVRIEDLVVVRDDCAEILTEYEKQLVID